MSASINLSGAGLQFPIQLVTGLRDCEDICSMGCDDMMCTTSCNNGCTEVCDYSCVESCTIGCTFICSSESQACK